METSTYYSDTEINYGNSNNELDISWNDFDTELDVKESVANANAYCSQLILFGLLSAYFVSISYVSFKLF